MTYEELKRGLEEREFTGISGMCSMGKCHKDKEHYVLLTDGLVIYSTVPHWRNVRYLPNELEESWPLEQSEYDIEHNIKAFSFEEFDEVMKIRYEKK